jgi:hypothetical protein
MSLPKTPAILVKSPNISDKKKKDNPFDSKQAAKQPMTPQPTILPSNKKMLTHKDD